jgi:hypothetical protein
MKVSEFEAKLGAVSDAKLRQMLAASRAQGPEVAVSLILAEARRRGMDELEEAVPVRAAAIATSAYPREGAGAFGSDAPAEAALSPAGVDAPPADSAAPALAPEWLAEETKSGMPLAVKAILLLVAVGCVLAVAWKFTR